MLPFQTPGVVAAAVVGGVPGAPVGDDWIHEIKHDGFRMTLPDVQPTGAKPRTPLARRCDGKRKRIGVASGEGTLGLRKPRKPG